jgi:lysophospholipase L1-like esterase
MAKRSILVVTALLVVLVAWVPIATATTLIAVQSNASGSPQIYGWSPGGSIGGGQQLTSSGWNQQPAVSPDGTKIAFNNYTSGVDRLKIMNADGTGTFTVGSVSGGRPAWSPDGTKLAIESNNALYMVDASASGTNYHRLGTDTTIFHPSWSPDGSQIAYGIYRGAGKYEIHKISSSANAMTTPTVVTDNTNANFFADNYPVWSPDGDKIAFVSNRANSPTNNVYTMNPDGTGITAVTAFAGAPSVQYVDYAAGGGVLYFTAFNGSPPPGAAVQRAYMVGANGGASTAVSTDRADVVSIQRPALPTVPSSGAKYVALGDSVASGEGLNYGWTWSSESPYGSWSTGTPTSWVNYPDSTDDQHCHQSEDGYPYLVAAATNATLLNLACSGSSAGNGILRDRVFDDNTATDEPQLGIDEVLYDAPNQAYDDAEPDVVSLSLGANDVQFAKYVDACYSFSLFDCNNSTADNDLATLLANQIANLRKVLQEIRDRGASASTPKIPRVIVTTYYDTFPATYSSSCPDVQPTAFTVLTSIEMSWLRGWLRRLNMNILSAASEFENVVAVPLESTMNGHGFCSASPWVYGISLRVVPGPSDNNNPAPFHPTHYGQGVIAELVENAFD